MKKISTLIIVPSLAGGGAEKVILSLIENMNKNDFTIFLVLINSSGQLVPKLPKKNIIDLKYSRFRNAFLSLVKIINFKKPDIIISSFPHITLPLLSIKRFLPENTSIIAREPNMVSLSLSNSSFLILLKIMHKLLLPFADKVIVNSNAMYLDLQKRGVNISKLEVLHNPVDYIKLRNIKTFIRYSGRGLRLISVGRLVYQKGFDRLLPIIKNIKNCHLTILGEGNEFKNLNRLVEDLNIKEKIDFKGYKNDSNRYIAAADFFVLPSRWEGLPNVVLESLVLGTPVVSFKEIEGLKDILPFVKNNSLFMCNDENEMKHYLSNAKPRRDYNNIKLKNNLLKKFNTPQDYSLKFSEVLKGIFFENNN
jgi:glycosyltransferase involved in cell wall biosynthesis